MGAHIQLVAQVDQRLNAALGEAAGLAAIDKQLSDQISAEQEQLRAEAFTRQAAAIQAATAAATVAPPTTVPKKQNPPTTTTTPPRVTPPSLYTIADMQLVHGIYVNKLIAVNFARMMDAARGRRADARRWGLPRLGRADPDPDQQLRSHRLRHLREARRPVQPADRSAGHLDARAGHGHRPHVLGCAIRDHASICFVWLAANAASSGSTTCRPSPGTGPSTETDAASPPPMIDGSALAAALWERLAPAVPDGIELVVEASTLGVAVVGAGSPRKEFDLDWVTVMGDDVRSSLQRMCWTVLDQLQDVVVEATTTPWPGTRRMPVPVVVVNDDEILLSYVDSDGTVVMSMQPIRWSE